MVVRYWPFLDLLPSQGELGTACYADDVREVFAWEESFEGGRVGDLGRFGGFGVRWGLLGELGELQLGGTPQSPDTAEVSISLRDQIGELKVLQ